MTSKSSISFFKDFRSFSGLYLAFIWPLSGFYQAFISPLLGLYLNTSPRNKCKHLNLNFSIKISLLHCKTAGNLPANNKTTQQHSTIIQHSKFNNRKMKIKISKRKFSRNVSRSRMIFIFVRVKKKSSQSE